jgi:hypothetical protein
MELLAERLANAQTKLESADKDNFRFEQGRVAELRDALELEQAAEAVIEAERALRVRPPSID